MTTNQEMNAELREAVTQLKNGKVILCPTDTIWGLTCDATNESAVNELMKLKQRDPSKGLVVLVSHDAMLERYVKEVPDIAWELIDNADSPVTIVYPEGKNLAKSALADDQTIGIRIIKEGFCNQLIRLFNRPIVSTSANFSGKETPIDFFQIEDEMIEKVSGVFGKDFEDITGRPSSVIKLGLKGEVKVLRE